MVALSVSLSFSLFFLANIHFLPFSLFYTMVSRSQYSLYVYLSTSVSASLCFCLVLLLQLKYKSFLLRSFLQVNRERLKMFDKWKIKKHFFKKTFVNKFVVQKKNLINKKRAFICSKICSTDILLSCFNQKPKAPFLV
jgi:hypothetical protein